MATGDETKMAVALDQAREAAKLDEVPIGAAIFYQGKGVSVGFNCRERDADVTAHAEMIALRSAAKALGDWRLEEHDLFVTLEPCLMCFAACCQSRIRRIVYGAQNPKNPKQLRDVYMTWPGAPEVIGGIMEEESRSLLSSFFSTLR